MFEPTVILDKFHQLRGHYSRVSWAIRLVFKLCRDMPINMVTKFGDDWTSIVQVRESQQISPLNGAITPSVLDNSACHQTPQDIALGP